MRQRISRENVVPPPEQPEGKTEVSIVAPLHNESGNAAPLYNAIKRTMDTTNKPYEIIFVNDASTDNTLSILKEIRKNDDRFHICDLKYNSGENWALQAGISVARGNIIVTIDGDFQNDPIYIPDLLSKIKEGYLVVSGRRSRRKENYIKRVVPSLIANWLISTVSGIDVHDCGCGLKAYKRHVLEGKYVPRGFMNRFSPVIWGITNEQFTEVTITDRTREYGKSHYGLTRIFIVFNDILALPFILRDHNKIKPIVSITLAIVTAIFLLSVAGGFTISGYYFYIAGILFLLIIALISIRWNLNRFYIARDNPEFTIKDYA